MSHILVAPLPDAFADLARTSCVMLAEQPEVHRATVFVHGFAGHPVKTWSRMQDLIESDETWKSTDAYFVGYDSTRDEVMLSATYVANFLQTMYPKPPSSLFTTATAHTEYRLRAEATSYKSIDLVGHSLGGVVLREAILDLLHREIDAIDSNNITSAPGSHSVPCKATLRLFAPAQGGARLSGINGVASQLIGLRWLVDMFRGKSPSFQELEPRSPLLLALREDTNYYAEQYPDFTALRAKITWAHHDKVVTSLPYRHDTSYRLAKTSHASVCKPTALFPAPFVFASTGALEREDGAI